GCGWNAIALGQQPRNFQLDVDRAFAPHLGRMSGEHRLDQGPIEERLELLAGNACPRAARKRVGHRALLRWGAAEGVPPGQSDQVLILRHVGEVQEKGISTDDVYRVLVGKAS